MTAFSGTSDDKHSWKPTLLSANGYPQAMTAMDGNAPVPISFDLGLHSDALWSIPEGTASMADLGTLLADLPLLGNAQRQVLSVTNFNSGSSTLYQSQNGYPRGYLKSTSVNSAGVLTGYFSNGQSQDLYKIPLADFINPQGLFRKAATDSRNQGIRAAILGWAGEGRLGLMAGSTLESSNVDLAVEFVEMISSQRSFDANSKAIITGDQVIQTAIQMKK